MMRIFQQFFFEAARKLPNLPPSHPCASIHGHSFILVLHLEGELHGEYGWVMDFADLKKACAPELKILDHKFLNEIKGLENPTTENIARWLWQRLTKKLPQLVEIELKESRDSGCRIGR